MTSLPPSPSIVVGPAIVRMLISSLNSFARGVSLPPRTRTLEPAGVESTKKLSLPEPRWTSIASNAL